MIRNKTFFKTIILISFVLSLKLPLFAQKVYIDITSPGFRKVPIAIQTFSNGKELSNIIIDNLEYTGLFSIVDEKLHIEGNEQPFNKNNWTSLQAEIVVKGQVINDKAIKVSFSVYEVSDGREILRKEYTSKQMSRQIAHAIANDIYKILTGYDGIFKTKISYVSDKGKHKELKIMDWDGHRAYETGITADIFLSPKWTSDGSKLIYSKNTSGRWGIFTLDMHSLKEQNVFKEKGLSVSGNFLPNNKEFVFVTTKDGVFDIYLGNIVSLTYKKVISSPWIDISPTVSPDGKKILFTSNRTGSPQIFISDINGNNIKRLTNEGSYNTSPVWSPKGDKIAFVSMINGRHQIMIMSIDGTGLTQLTNSGNNEEPSFSPDGRFITFTSDRDGIKGIYIMRSDGSGQRRITSQKLKATNPSWSPF
ncbi:MAG: Tol-Pal system beta propeller repeat protein TolB [Thermodesulfovibrionales bacterium]|nr:Tol-Pal system beta propeller repeat protein TolB [Thermodesulfovibrionales bacterium]